MSTTLATPLPATSPDHAPAAESRPTRGPRARVHRSYYAMVIPALALFALFHTIPLLIGVFFSFTNYAGYGDWKLIGLANYLNLFQDDRVLKAYGFTFLFAVTATVITNVISLAVALALNAKIPAKNFFRGVMFVPYVLAVLVAGYVFQFLFAHSLPKLLDFIPLFRDNLLANADWAWLGIVVFAVWQASAFATILYLAGLQTIDQDIYEATALDGASGWQTFRHITFPLISPFFTINMVLSLKGFLQVFDQVVALTNGGPGTSTESITLLIYKSGFQSGEYAYQTANAVVFVVVITVLSFLQLRFLNRKEAV
jgi:raffinose/stachyose/melibiose transport system permease protein